MFIMVTSNFAKKSEGAKPPLAPPPQVPTPMTDFAMYGVGLCYNVAPKKKKMNLNCLFISMFNCLFISMLNKFPF